MLRHYAVLETKDTKVEHCCTHSHPGSLGMNHHSKKVTMIPKTPQLTGHFFTLMDGARKIRSKKIIINRKKIPSAESEWERDVFTKLIHRENWLWAQKILPTPPKVTSIKIEAAGMSGVRLQTHTSACDVTAPRAPAASCCVWLPEHRWYCDGNRRAEPKPRRFPCVAMETNIHTSVRYWSTRLAMPLWPIKHIVSTAQRWRHRSSTSFEAAQAVDDSRYSKQWWLL